MIPMITMTVDEAEADPGGDVGARLRRPAAGAPGGRGWPRAGGRVGGFRDV